MKLTIPGLIILLVLTVFSTGCDVSAPFSIDPVELEAPFTFSPTSGHPGQTVVISGRGLADVTRVSFSLREAPIISKADTEIRVTIPVGATTGKIRLVKPNSVVSSTTEFRVDPTPVPNIISFTPAVVGRNQPVVITGNLLDQVDSVYVGNLRATIVDRTASTLNITTPAAMVSAPIRMFYDFLTEFGFTQVREAVSATELSLALPVINSIMPDITALDVGMVVTIDGTMMDAVTLVRFGTINAPTFTIVSPTRLTVTVPPGATTGRIILTVPDGTVQSAADFRVVLPVISNFFPQKGAELVGGTRDITLTGTGFDRVTEARLGTTPVSIMAQTSTNLTVRIGGSQTGVINLVTANGIVSTPIPFIITGDFWLVDFDRTFSPHRFTSSGWDQATTVSSLASVASGEARGNFGRTTATFPSGDVWPRFWIRGDGGGTMFPGAPAAHPAPDRFLLYTSSSHGVFLEFDLNLGEVPPQIVDAHGNVRVKLVLAAAAGDTPWGYATMLTVPADPNTWTSFRINTHTMGGGGTGVVIFSTEVPPLGAARWNPSRNRLFGFIFVDARNIPEIVGRRVTLNIDNVRFRVE